MISKNRVRTADDFFVWCEQWLGGDSYVTDYHGARKGQTYFNALKEFKPDLADKIRASEVDPFYSDSKIPAFIEFVRSRWDSL